MSKKAWAILKRMQRTKAGFGQKDLETLYLGFGFDFEEGAKHRKYFHPKHHDLANRVGRHDRGLSKGYVDDAIDTIDILIKREGLSDK